MVFFIFNQAQQERHENVILRQENEKLRAENGFLKDAMRSPVCNNCGGAVTPGEVSYEQQQQLRIENAKLKDELDRICALANRFIGGSISLEQPSNIGSQHLPIGGHGFNVSMSDESSMFMNLAVEAMDELVKLAESNNPLWTKCAKSARESMNQDEYRSTDPGFVGQGSRETGLVLISSLDLVETLMNTVCKTFIYIHILLVKTFLDFGFFEQNKWAEMFECIVSVASTVEVISNGSDGSRNGSLLLVCCSRKTI